MPVPLTIPEIFEEYDLEPGTSKRKKLLEKQKNNTVFRDILKNLYTKKIVFHDVGQPVWNKDAAPHGLNPSNLSQAIRQLYIFTVGDPKSIGITESVRRKKLVQIMESLHPSEAELFLKLLRKDLQIKGLTAKMINEVFPNLVVK
jgi:hypothetical protein